MSDRLDPAQFIDKTGVDWRGLARVGVGGVLVTYALGIVEILHGVTAFYEHILGALAGWLAALSAAAFATPASLIRTTFANASRFYASLGPIGGPLAVAVTLVALYIVMRGVVDRG